MENVNKDKKYSEFWLISNCRNLALCLVITFLSYLIRFLTTFYLIFSPRGPKLPIYLIHLEKDLKKIEAQESRNGGGSKGHDLN